MQESEEAYEALALELANHPERLANKVKQTNRLANLLIPKYINIWKMATRRYAKLCDGKPPRQLPC